MNPFTLHLSQRQDKKMSGEIKFKGHPCLTFSGKSWIQKPFYQNLVTILNISQTNEPKSDSDMGGDPVPVSDNLDSGN